MRDAAGTLVEVLGADRVDVLELPRGGGALVMRVSAGPHAGEPETEVACTPERLAVFALEHDEPIPIGDLQGDPRFSAPVLRAAGMASGVICRIGARAAPFGVLGAFTLEPRAFGADDANFVQAVANTLAAAVERARAEEEALELADAAPTLMWTTDADGRVTFVNRRWLEFTGQALGDVVGAEGARSAHPDDRDEALARFRQALERREEFRMEYRLRRADGSWRWVLGVGVPRYARGEFAGYVGTATDIHERRTIEQALRRVYERERRIAETLQRSLLPEKLPEIAGVELAARYLPAGAEGAIGGDWYDAVELDGGRLALVVGDVVGHGLRAAVVMGELRNAVRAYALVGPSPAEILRRLNRLVGHDVGGPMATVLCLVLDRRRGVATFASAGHLPPLLVAPDGPRFLEGGRSVPIGASPDPGFAERREELPPGSTLVLYTDGLVERRRAPLERRLAMLAEAAARSRSGLEQLCDDLLAGALDGAPPADDVALLAVRPLGPAAPPGPLRLRRPARASELLALRRRVRAFLADAGASEQVCHDVALAVSEAAANAVEHAYAGRAPGEVEVELAVEGGEIVACVRDHGRWREPQSEHRGRGLRIIGVLMDAVAVEHDEGGTQVRMRRRLSD